MRIRAKPPKSVRTIQPHVPASNKAYSHTEASASAPVRWAGRGLIVLATLVSLAVTLALALWSAVPERPPPTTSPPPAPTAAPEPSSPSVRPSPSPTPTQTGSPGPPPNPSRTVAPDSAWLRPVALALGLSAIAFGAVTGTATFVRRRHRRRARRLRPEPVRLSPPANEKPGMRPRASLGMPDILVLTEATTDEDLRLREHLAQQTDAVFANLQFACSFDQAADWTFVQARLSVVLSRGDGRPAPAPIAYSLRPLNEHDGDAREQTAELGADVKFVTAKLGERRTRPGAPFVRGYGLQESTSYWEFTPTTNSPLQGSYYLWVIAKAPTGSDLLIRSSLEIQVVPRSWWLTGDGPVVEGVGDMALLLHLTRGVPYEVEDLTPTRGGRPTDGSSRDDTP